MLNAVICARFSNNRIPKYPFSYGSLSSSRKSSSPFTENRETPSCTVITTSYQLFGFNKCFSSVYSCNNGFTRLSSFVL